MTFNAKKLTHGFLSKPDGFALNKDFDFYIAVGGGIEEEIRKVFWEEPDIGIAIAKCESGLNPKAINTTNTNGTTDKGLMQLNSVHDLSGVDVWDVQDNLAFARKLYDSKGWLPWVCFTKKLYVL